MQGRFQKFLSIKDFGKRLKERRGQDFATQNGRPVLIAIGNRHISQNT